MALLLGLVLWCVITVFAHIWMKRFYFGPFEWLWRKATYVGLPVDTPIKRKVMA